MRQRTALEAAGVVAVGIALVLSVQLGAIPLGGTALGTSTTCTGCTQQPVVDVIMPLLGSSGNTSNPNRQVNLTVGSTAYFEVDVYPTEGLNFSMGFRAVMVAAPSGTSGGSGEMIATFSPPTLSVGANEKGATLMTVVAPGSAARGTYDVVVSVTDESNSSNVWGLYFQIVLS